MEDNTFVENIPVNERKIPRTLKQYLETTRFKEWWITMEEMRKTKSEDEFKEWLKNAPFSYIKILLIKISESSYSSTKLKNIAEIAEIFQERNWIKGSTKTVSFEPTPEIIVIRECPICFIDCKDIRVVFDCNHEFCAQCIIYMMEHNRIIKCPLCRKQIHSIFVFSKEIETIYSRHSYMNIVYSGGYINWFKVYSLFPIPYLNKFYDFGYYLFKESIIFIFIIIVATFLVAFIKTIDK
jgi:hypothetical protein